MQKTTDWSWRMEITYWERAQELISAPTEKLRAMPTGRHGFIWRGFFISQKYSNKNAATAPFYPSRG